MTEEEAKKEINKLFREYNERALIIIKEAKANGTWPMGLDSGKEFFVELDKEIKARMKKVIDMIDE